MNTSQSREIKRPACIILPQTRKDPDGQLRRGEAGGTPPTQPPWRASPLPLEGQVECSHGPGSRWGEPV